MAKAPVARAKTLDQPAPQAVDDWQSKLFPQHMKMGHNHGLSTGIHLMSSVAGSAAYSAAALMAGNASV